MGKIKRKIVNTFANWKNNWKYWAVGLCAGLLIGTGATFATLVVKHKACQSDIAACQKNTKAFCEGYSIGGARITEVTCNDKQELCFCGDPTKLKKGLLE